MNSGRSQGRGRTECILLLPGGRQEGAIGVGRWNRDLCGINSTHYMAAESRKRMAMTSDRLWQHWRLHATQTQWIDSFEIFGRLYLRCATGVRGKWAVGAEVAAGVVEATAGTVVHRPLVEDTEKFPLMSTCRAGSGISLEAGKLLTRVGSEANTR